MQYNGEVTRAFEDLKYYTRDINPEKRNNRRKKLSKNISQT